MYTTAEYAFCDLVVFDFKLNGLVEPLTFCG
jgi:hypothetical protein